jgi:hypothetical protein
MPTFIRQDQATISVPQLPVALPFVPSWATLEGGDLEAEDTKTRPGGMLPQVTLGGPTTRNDATVSRPYTRELHPFLVPLEKFAGFGRMAITYTIMGPNLTTGKLVTLGPTVTLRGILKNVTRPNWDANSASTAMFSLVMGCDVESHVTQ